jgi:hypothetical protein
MNNNYYGKVIGFFAYRERSQVISVEKDACLIAGSDEAMRQYIRDLTGMLPDKFTIRKTRLGEILDGVSAGAAYAFDEEAYSRFLPLARGAGLPAAEADFEKARLEGRQFFRVRFFRVRHVPVEL